MTYYDRLNRFFKKINMQPLTASAQLLYLHFLHIDNRTGHTGQFRCTIAELMRLTRLSKKTIIDARRILKSENLIDYPPRQGNNACLYRILDGEDQQSEQPAQPQKPSPQQPKQQPEAKSGYLSTNSAEVLRAWDNWNGVRLSDGIALELIQLENLYGTEKLLAAIEIAGKSNNRHNLSINFVKAILEERGRQNGTTGKHTEPAENWESKRPDWLDD